MMLFMFGWRLVEYVSVMCHIHARICMCAYILDIFPNNQNDKNNDTGSAFSIYNLIFKLI